MFEGEGSFSVSRSKQRNGKGEKEYLSFRMTMSSNDQDVIEEVQRIAGGNVRIAHGPRAQERGIKPRWDWALIGPPAEELGWKLAPYLMERRRLRFMELLMEVRTARDRGWWV